MQKLQGEKSTCKKISSDKYFQFGGHFTSFHCGETKLLGIHEMCSLTLLFRFQHMSFLGKHRTRNEFQIQHSHKITNYFNYNKTNLNEWDQTTYNACNFLLKSSRKINCFSVVLASLIITISIKLLTRSSKVK